MNRRMIFYTVGRIITLEAGLLLLPMAVGCSEPVRAMGAMDSLRSS